MVNAMSQAVINLSLKSCWCVFQPEKHTSVHELQVLGAYPSFVVVSSLHWEQLFAIGDIQLRKDLGSMRPVEHLHD